MWPLPTPLRGEEYRYYRLLLVTKLTCSLPRRGGKASSFTVLYNTWLHGWIFMPSTRRQTECVFFTVLHIFTDGKASGITHMIAAERTAQTAWSRNSPAGRSAISFFISKRAIVRKPQICAYSSSEAIQWNDLAGERQACWKDSLQVAPYLDIGIRHVLPIYLRFRKESLYRL